jgi:hypothetical protein
MEPQIGDEIEVYNVQCQWKPAKVVALTPGWFGEVWIDVFTEGEVRAGIPMSCENTEWRPHAKT